MKINYYWGFFELEAEDTRDEAWLEDWVKTNYKDIDFTFSDENEADYESKEYDPKNHIVTKITIGNY